jgi:hypothetical protein
VRALQRCVLLVEQNKSAKGHGPQRIPPKADDGLIRREVASLAVRVTAELKDRRQRRAGVAHVRAALTRIHNAWARGILPDGSRGAAYRPARK